MKKTVNINLGSQLFQIDEDAYQLLENYLNDLKNYFRREKESAEIIQDIECRFAELFGERNRLGYRIITIEIVEETIKRVGKPEELGDGKNEEENNGKENKHNDLNEERVKKRLYRNPDDKILGGVASGIAAYLDWDPVWIRLLLVALVFLKGVVIPIYLLMWAIMPKAATAAQKLEMRGKRITVENIGKTVTENFDRISGSIKEELNAKGETSGIRNIFDALLRVLGVLIKVSLAVLGLILLFPASIAVIVLLTALIIAFVGFMGLGIPIYHRFPSLGIPYDKPFIFDHSLSEILFVSGISHGFLWFSLLTACITIIMPLVVLGHFIVGAIKPLKPMNKIAKWVFLLLWLFSFGFTVYAIAQFYPAIMRLY